MNMILIFISFISFLFIYNYVNMNDTFIENYKNYYFYYYYFYYIDDIIFDFNLIIYYNNE